MTQAGEEIAWTSDNERVAHKQHPPSLWSETRGSRSTATDGGGRRGEGETECSASSLPGPPGLASLIHITRNHSVRHSATQTRADNHHKARQPCLSSVRGGERVRASVSSERLSCVGARARARVPYVRAG